MERIRATLVAIAVLVGVASVGVVTPDIARPAGAAGSNRAMVVVDTGTSVHRVVVTFSGSITGVQALELAGAQPVVYSFAGQGGAVCRLFGVGRDAGPNCLGGADGDNRYWAYFRAPAGTSTYTYSRAGAGSTQVHDGDVEGWKFGTGTAPPYAALPPVTTTTTAPPSGPGSTPPGQGSSTPPVAGSAAPGPSGAAAPSISAEDLLRIAAAASSTTTTTSTAASGSGTSEKAGTEVAGKRAVRSVKGSVMSDPGKAGGGGSAGSLVIFAVVAVALIGGGLLVRARRRRPVP